jgi:phosphoserine phosphatase RsbU/P
MLRAGVGVLACVASLPAMAQSSLTVTPSSCVYRMGDDPAWAQPGLDESGWVSSLPSPTKTLPDGPYHWNRCRLDLRPLARTGPVYLRIEEFAAWEAYVDGEKVASFGNLETGHYSMNLVQRFPLPERIVDRGVILVAIRETQRGVPQLSYTPQLSPLSAGAEKTLSDETAKAVQTQFTRRILQFICYGFVGSAGFFLLILSRVDRSRRDLFWLSVACMGLGLLRLNELAQVVLYPYPLWVQSTVQGFGQWTLTVYLIFFFSLTGRKIPLILLINACCLSLMLTIASLPARVADPRTDQIIIWWGFFNPVTLNIHGSMGMLNSMAPLFAFWPIWKVPKHLRVVFTVSLLWASGEFLNFAYRTQFLSHLDPTGFGREYRAIVTVPAVIAMFFLLARRHRKVAEERAELQGEMAAAQEMQRLLVPETLDLEPGIEMEVAYRPAKDVGGDFYFVRRTSAGQMVVIGDVSGKGLRAAMMASTLVGALRNEESTDPARVLERLNAVALSASSGGFVTCLCALFQHDGQLRFANAGQILPYLDGREVFADNGLPLGLVADATYEEATTQIHDRTVTLLSDGVLEAQNAVGELLGFERMAALTVKPAAEVADAAQKWGQEDDITVLTVRSVPATAGALA